MNPYAAPTSEQYGANRSNQPLWLFVASCMVAVAAMEILYVGQIRLDYMREHPTGYATFQMVVLVFALVVGVLNLSGSPPPMGRDFRVTGRVLGGLILGCCFFPAEPIARWIQNLFRYHPSHNFVIVILMLTISVLAATVAERLFRRVFRMVERGEPSHAPELADSSWVMEGPRRDPGDG